MPDKKWGIRRGLGIAIGLIGVAILISCMYIVVLILDGYTRTSNNNFVNGFFGTLLSWVLGVVFLAIGYAISKWGD
jgi:cell division protein FtsX